MVVRLDLKRPELSDAGAMDVLKAWDDGVSRCDIRTVCVRGSCDPDVWRGYVRASFVRRCDVRAVAVVCEIWIYGPLPYRCT